MSKRSLWVQIGIFLCFIALFFVLNLISPDTKFSQQENRFLQQRPEFSFSDLFSGRFTSDFETYVTDQFSLRDSWITLKARCELLLGKQENNGVYLCRDETLIEPFKAPDSSVLDSSLSALNTLCDNAGVPVYFALIPDKSELYSGILPANTPRDSEKELIDYCYGLSGAVNVDCLSPLAAHADEYIFYRTDHHWTSRGAYYGASALLEAMGMESRPQSEYEPTVVTEEFYGTTYSSSGFSWVSPDSMEIWVQEREGLDITNYPTGAPVEGALYNMDKLNEKDKYSMFMGGNSPLQQISTGVEDAPSLLIVRDSYTDSLVPFLLDDFSEIHLLDLRYYRAGLAQYITDNNIDNVLVCYSVSNFCTDTNLFLLGR